MTADIFLGRDLQQTLVRQELMRSPRVIRVPLCRLISVAGADPMLEINRALHVRTLRSYGFGCEDVALAAGTTLAELRAHITEANDDPSVDGIMVLMPLPPHLQVTDVLPLISAVKELEGLHPEHSAALLATVPGTEGTVRPLVPDALHATVSELGMDLDECTVVLLTEPTLMRSNPVANLIARVAGPASLPLGAAVCIVPVDHPRAREIAKTADLLIVSLESPEVVDATYVRDQAVVVDFNPIWVGSVQVDGQMRPILKGGVHNESVAPVASTLMPVPGGVGPVMLGILMRNLIRAARRSERVLA